MAKTKLKEAEERGSEAKRGGLEAFSVCVWFANLQFFARCKCAAVQHVHVASPFNLRMFGIYVHIHSINSIDSQECMCHRCWCFSTGIPVDKTTLLRSDARLKVRDYKS